DFVNLETLLKESDIITIHIPLTPETKGMIGDKEFSLMKKDALLINTARGPIVNEEALIKALKEKRIAGAALDVFEKEPPDKDNPLFKLENVIVAPHMASYTVEALSRVDLTLAQDLVKALKGEKPQYIANPQVFER
ncbi:MAG: NAD(P)-dependent oxidoreductase, partial [Nitrososphaerota archaeon]